MKPRIKIGEAQTANGSKVELIQHDRDYVITIDGDVLMSTRLRASEEDLATIGLERATKGAKVLIGGLGMGYTLRAALDALPEDGHVTQVELVPEIIQWNKGPLAELAQNPMDDERAEVVVGDVADIIRDNPKSYDAIILDVDNGPTAMVADGNSRLYSRRGLRRIYECLNKGGRVVVWSANDDQDFTRLMGVVGFQMSVFRPKREKSKRNTKHVIFVGNK